MSLCSANYTWDVKTCLNMESTHEKRSRWAAITSLAHGVNATYMAIYHTLWNYVRDFMWPSIPNVPVIDGYPVLGIFPDMCKDGVFVGTMSRMFDAAEKCGISAAWAGSVPMFYLREPSVIRQVLVLNDDKITRVGPDGKGPFGILERAVGDMAITSDGLDCQRWRKELLRTFSRPAALRASYDKIFEITRYHVEKIKKKAYGADLKKEMEAYAVDLIWCLSVGANNVSQTENLFKPLPRQFILLGNPSHHWRHIFRNFANWQPFKEPDAVEADIKADISKIVRHILQKNLTANEKGSHQGDYDDARDCFLKQLSGETGGTAENPITKDVLAQALQIYTFGHEASALAMYWGISELSAHVEVVQKLRNELIQHVNTPDDLTFLSFDSMPYLDAVVTEILRVHPPISTSSRIVTNGITVRNRYNNDVFFPKGAMLFSSIHFLHHDKQVWGDDVEKFLPERWLGVCKNAVENRCEYFPFLSGPRSCPSARFVILQLKAMLAVLFFDSDVTLNTKKVDKSIGGVVRSSKATDFRVTKVNTTPAAMSHTRLYGAAWTE